MTVDTATLQTNVATRTGLQSDDPNVIRSVDAAVSHVARYCETTTDELPADDDQLEIGLELLAVRMLNASPHPAGEIAVLTDDVLNSMGNPWDLDRGLARYWVHLRTGWGVA